MSSCWVRCLLQVRVATRSATSLVIAVGEGSGEIVILDTVSQQTVAMRTWRQHLAFSYLHKPPALQSLGGRLVKEHRQAMGKSGTALSDASFMHSGTVCWCMRVHCAWRAPLAHSRTPSVFRVCTSSLGWWPSFEKAGEC